MNETIEQKSGKFLDKKRFAIISISLIISIVLTVLTMTTVLKIDFNKLMNLIFIGFGKGGLNILWFFLLFLYVPFRFISAIYPVSCRLKKLNIKIPFSEKVLFALTWSFLSFVTPANFVTDPYTIFWLKTNKLSNVQASSIILSNAVLWQICQMVITIPSVIIMSMNYNTIIGYGTEGYLVFWMMITGMCLDFFVLAFLCVVCSSKNIQMWTSVCFNYIKKLLRMKYHTKAQTKAKYLGRGEFLKQIKSYIQDWSGTIKICLFISVCEIFIYILLCVSILFVLPTGSDLNIGIVFNEVNVAVTANKFVPLPGNQGSLEWCLSTIIKIEDPFINVPKEQIDDIISSSIVIWRLSTVYVPAGLGIFGFVWLTINQFKKTKKTGQLF